jgi:putative methanogenesis marker 16 metalloprotein
MKSRSIEDIKQKIMDGTAVVMTVEELIQDVAKGKEVGFDDVDVITTATKGLMSGTSAIMALRVSEPKIFKKAKSISMNDIDCYVGPCPNETLGLVDLILNATDHSKSDPYYGAGHLLRELVENKPVHIKVVTDEDKIIEKDITIDDIYFANIMGIRHAFKNYNAFVNPSEKKIKSIFTVMGLEPNESEITICGTGAVNPLANDPQMDILGVGSPILMNGSLGQIIGCGTRSSPTRPNLMTMAPLFDMHPKYMGGFITGFGPEVIVSIAAAIPILNETIWENVRKSDSQCILNVVDIVGRTVLNKSHYGEAWHKNYCMKYRKSHCVQCEEKVEGKEVMTCPVEQYCPTHAFSLKGDGGRKVGIDRNKCFNCGTCIKLCPHGAFECNLGELTVGNKKIPITLRQSDRHGAIDLMKDLKKLIIEGKFPIRLPHEKPVIYEEKIETQREAKKL